MEGSWVSYPLLVDSEPASILVNIGIGRQGPLKSHSQMAYLRLVMRQPRSDGLSSQDEFASLMALEDAILPTIEQPAATVFVGRNTSSGTRDFFFYTTDQAAFEAAAHRAMSAFPAYDYELGGRPDDDWSVYFTFLHPSPDNMQCIKNRDVLDALKGHGDLTNVRRPIDHWAYFPARRPAQQFANRVRLQGFTIRYGPEETEDGRFVVSFSRMDAPDALDPATIALLHLATELGGDYDGWGTPVVKTEAEAAAESQG